jgi:hypothetical protein
MKPNIFFISILLFVSVSHSAYVNLNNGIKGKLEIVDTLSLYDSSKGSIRVKLKSGYSYLKKSHVNFMVINSDTINFINNIAAHYDLPHSSKSPGHTEQTLSNFKNVKITGAVMAGIGTALTIAGVSFLSKVKQPTYDTIRGSLFGEYIVPHESGPDPNRQNATICLSLGIPSFIGGLVIACIAIHNENEFKNKLENVSVGLSLNRKLKGINFSYSF